MKKKAIIIGGGPAGLAAAYELSGNNFPCILLEQSSKLGGIARTESYNNYYFDLGGHRFFSKSDIINRLWDEIMDHELLIRSRLSRIYYRRQYFNYPLKPFNALFGLGLLTSTQIIASYLKQRVFPYPEEKTFKEWVVNRFGRKLFEIFFESYTEKVWGLSCQEIGAEWAAQRIKGLSLTSAVINAFLGNRSNQIKTLIDQFKYPKYGPGQMWEKMADKIEKMGGEIRLNSKVSALQLRENQIITCEVNGKELLQADYFINSMPLRNLIQLLNQTFADNLKYRAFLIVALIIKQKELFPDNWLYIHEPKVKLARIQNFKNWSPFMVPDPNCTCLGLEYFCNVNDPLWNTPNQDLIELGKNELVKIGLLRGQNAVIDGTVIRINDAYPVYDRAYAEGMKKIREYLATISNLQTIGRAGMHRYNNMDHSMLTGLFAAKNILAGQNEYDLWQVNADEEYHESRSV